MRHTISDYGLTYGRVPIFIDSTSAINLAKNPILHSRSKHIDVRFHFLRDHYQKGDVELNHVSTDNQVANILTKPLEQATYARLRGELGMCYPF